MSEFTRYDFSESLDRAGEPKAEEVKRCVAAWGVQGREYADWSGGFVVELKDGRFAYLTGWSDSSGWGCQDGASVEFFAANPDLGELKAKASDYDREHVVWDESPTDLNGWIERGCNPDER